MKVVKLISPGYSHEISDLIAVHITKYKHKQFVIYL